MSLFNGRNYAALTAMSVMALGAGNAVANTNNRTAPILPGRSMQAAASPKTEYEILSGCAEEIVNANGSDKQTKTVTAFSSHFQRGKTKLVKGKFATKRFVTEQFVGRYAAAEISMPDIGGRPGITLLIGQTYGADDEERVGHYFTAKTVDGLVGMPGGNFTNSLTTDAPAQKAVADAHSKEIEARAKSARLDLLQCAQKGGIKILVIK